MIQKVKSNQWYKVDLLIDWGQHEEGYETNKNQYVSIFVDGVYKTRQNFFNNLILQAGNEP
jgi:hypothetical protein